MRNLHMTLDCNPTADLASCESFGLHKTPLRVSTTNHLELDLLSSFTTTWKKNHPTASAHAAGDEKKADPTVEPDASGCPACSGKQRTQTYKPGCRKYKGSEPSTEGSSEPSTSGPKPSTEGDAPSRKLTKKAKPSFKPKVPVAAGEPVLGADKGARWCQATWVK